MKLRTFSLLVLVSCLATGFSNFLKAEDAKPAAENKPADWKPLFDGKSLQGWMVTDFGGQGETSVKDGELMIEAGEGLSGVQYTNDLPKVNYEMELEAKKIVGSDFFCGLTFPYKESAATFIVGGWGGAVVGISSINSSDASENETTKYRKFEKDHWYRVRVRVTASRIQTWIDDELMADVDTTDKKIRLRYGPIEVQKPMGLSTYQTASHFRNVRIRPVEAAAEK